MLFRSLRFVPYIGSMMAGILPVIIAAAIGEGWNLAFVTAGILITIEIAIGQFIEPLLFGKMTGLSPVAVVASAAFWTALWPNWFDHCNTVDHWLVGGWPKY